MYRVLLVSLMEFHDFVFQFVALAGSKAELTQVAGVVTMLLRVIITKLPLDNIRSEKGMCYHGAG